MPAMMNVFQPMEIVIMPDITYPHQRHPIHQGGIYTDGRDWPNGASAFHERRPCGLLAAPGPDVRSRVRSDRPGPRSGLFG
jgi:hypothetical protein